MIVARDHVVNRVATKDDIEGAVERSELRMTIRMGVMFIGAVTIILAAIPLLIK